MLSKSQERGWERDRGGTWVRKWKKSRVREVEEEKWGKLENRGKGESEE